MPRRLALDDRAGDWRRGPFDFAGNGIRIGKCQSQLMYILLEADGMMTLPVCR